MSETREIIDIPIEQTVPHPNQPAHRNGVEDLVESIKLIGLSEPIVVVPFGEPPVQYMIVSGHRRVAAFKELGFADIPAIVAKDSTMNHEATLLFTTQQLVAANINREDFTTLQEAAVMQTMLDLGLSVEDVARTTGEDIGKVKTLVNITEFIKPATFKKFEQDPDLTIPEAIALSEFADDPDAEATLIENIGDEQFMHIYAKLKNERRRNQLYNVALTNLEEIGVTTIDPPDYDEKKIIPLATLGISPDNHRSCDGHAAYVRIGWQSEKADTVYVCLDAKKHHNYAPPKRSEHDQAQLDAAREGREFEKDGQAPTQVRREWLIEQLKNKAKVWKGEYQWLAYVAAHRMFSSQKTTFEILALKPDTNDYGPSYPVARLLPKSEPLSHKTLIAMSFAGIDEDLRLAQGISNYRTTHAPAYLTFLKKNGYTLSLHEEQFLAPTEDVG